MSVYKIVTLFCVFLLLFANRATGISIIHDDRSINFVSLTCTDDFSVGPVLASFYYNSSESGLLGQPTIYHNLTLNKTNEGRYTCKTTTIDVGISDPLILIPIPVRTDLSSTRSFTWGSPLTLNCSYQPGVYPDGYNLTWMITISRSTRTIIEQAQSAPFSINSNAHELSVQFYTPLLEASYQCKVIVSSLTPSLYYGNIITVSTNEEIGDVNKILLYPDNKAILVNEMYFFTCEASVRSNEMMTFELFNTTITAESGNMDCHSQVNYTRLYCFNIQFGHVNANISCDFIIPYKVSCTYSIIGGLQEGDYTDVSCSIGSDKQTWKLIVRSTIPPKPVIFEEHSIWIVGIVLPFSYGGIIPNITIIINYLNGTTNNYIILCNDITIDGIYIIFPLPNDISGIFSVAYRMSFFGEDGELSEFSEETVIQPSSFPLSPPPSSSSTTPVFLRSSSFLLTSFMPTSSPITLPSIDTNNVNEILVTISVPVVVGVILVIILITVVVLLVSIFRRCVPKRKPSLLVLGSRSPRPSRYITEMEEDCSNSDSELLLLPHLDSGSTCEISLIGDHTPIHVHQSSHCSSSYYTKDVPQYDYYHHYHTKKQWSQKAVTIDKYSTKDDVFPLLPRSPIGENISLSEPLSIPLPTVFFNQTALYSSPVPTNQENSDDSGSTDDNIVSLHPGSNPHLDPKESIISSTVKIFSKNIPRHYQTYDSSSSGVYSSSDLENKAPSYISSHDKTHPASSDTEASLYDRESSPSPLLLQQLCSKQMTNLSAASDSLQHKHHKKQTPPHDKQMDLDILKDIFGELTVFEVSTTGLVHHCSQYGVTLIIPEGAIEHTAIVWFGVCLFSDKFKFEDDYIPVSPIVWIYINCQLIKPAELYIPHHIDVSNMKDTNNQLYLLTADDESFRSDKIFTFKQNHEYQVTIESTLVKVLTPHFCSNCIAAKGSTYKEIPKKYLIAQADKREDDTLFVEFSLLYRQKGCMKMLDKQCIREGYNQSSYLPVEFTGSGCVSIAIDPGSIPDWNWSYYGVNYDYISDDSINYYKVMGCEGGEVTSDDIEMLEQLEYICSYPPRFRLKFQPIKIVNNIRSHNVTVTFNNVTPPTKATITLPGNGHLSLPLLSPPLTPKTDPGCFSKKTDPLFGDILHVITNKNHLKEKWFNFGYELGLTPGQLHDIETKYYESLQCTREVLLQWRVNNLNEPLDLLVDALCKIGLIDMAVHIKYHFINPEQQSQEELYDVYHHLYDKYHVISSQTVSSVNGDPSEIFRVQSVGLCNAIEADPLRIVNSLIADNLLALNIRNDVSSMNGTSYDKANKIVGELQRQIVANDNPVQFLRQICKVLIKQEDKTLSNIGTKMMNLLTSDHHNKISSTSDNTYDHNTCKPELPLVSNLSTKSDQQLMEEPDGVYCSLCNKYHGVHSQTTSPADTYPLPDVSNHSCTEETRLESPITNLKEELLSTHQQQHLFSPIKEAEMEMQDILNKLSIIPLEEEDSGIHDVPPIDVENKTSSFFVIGKSQHEEYLDTAM